MYYYYYLLANSSIFWFPPLKGNFVHRQNTLQNESSREAKACRIISELSLVVVILLINCWITCFTMDILLISLKIGLFFSLFATLLNLLRRGTRFFLEYYGRFKAHSSVLIAGAFDRFQTRKSTQTNSTADFRPDIRRYSRVSRHR